MIKLRLRRSRHCLTASMLAIFALGAQAQATLRSRSAWSCLPPGRRADICLAPARAEAHRKLGVQVLVDNRAGAGAPIGSDSAAKRAPTATRSSWDEQHARVRAEPLQQAPLRSVRDFAPVTLVASATILLAVLLRCRRAA